MTVWGDIADALRPDDDTAKVGRFAVVDTSPLALEQIDGDEHLEDGDDDVAVSDALRQYEKNYPLAIGDVVLAIESGGVWTLTDVESDRELEDLKNSSGGGSSRSKFTQAVPALTWTIDYVGPVPPAVTIVVDGEKVETDVDYNETTKQITVTFGSPTYGVAYLS